MKVPGSPRLHVWVGLLVALAGVVVGGFAYTGERVYDLWFVGVAFLGFVLVLGGSVLAGYGQANRPRLGRVTRGNEEDEEEDASSWADRVRAWGASLRARVGGGEEGAGRGERLSVEMRCPSCEASFSSEGEPPFEAACPTCGFEGVVEAPAS